MGMAAPLFGNLYSVRAVCVLLNTEDPRELLGLAYSKAASWFFCIGSSDRPTPAIIPQPKDLSTLPSHKINNSRSDSLHLQTQKQSSSIYPAATPEIIPTDLPGGESQASVRRRSSFTSPRFEMVSGRTPLGAWHSVAAKVVAANRHRGIGGESVVREFEIEELGGQNGKLVFGPVAVFNGNISLRLKRPLKGMTLTVTFNGVAEVEKYLVTFISISHDIYSGDINEGLRTFLFGFNFPYLNLPPTSRSPQLEYSFTAKLTNTNGTVADDSSSTKSRILEYKSKPLEIIFIPYIDPFLDSPHIPRASTNNSPKEKNGKSVELIKDKPVNGNFCPVHGVGSSPGAAKPKLTLTTADLPSSASSNSTPIIDKPRPLNPSATRTVIMKDDDNKAVAKLRVDLTKIKFLPDEEIVIKIRLTIKDSWTMPKGVGVRVVETRFLSRIDSGSDDEESGSDDERQRDMKVVGKKHSKILTSKKFIIHPEEAYTVKEAEKGSSAPSIEKDENIALEGGREIELPIKIRLPGFQTFINDFLLPTATLPLGPSVAAIDSNITIGHSERLPDLGYSGKGKGKSPALSPAASYPTTTNTSISINSTNKDLNFVVSHILQVTIPISGNGSWFKKSTSTGRELDVAIPIIMGNINPLTPSRKKLPEVRLNALEEIRYGSGVGSSRSSGRSSFGSTSGAGAPSGSGTGGPLVFGTKSPTWKEGERFLTLKETDVHPCFVKGP